MLAGVSAEYYVQVERGQVSGVSEEVLQAIATALRLDDVETAHLFDLTRSTRRKAATRRSRTAAVPESVKALLDHLVEAPAIVQSGRLDIVAANELGRALYAPVFERAGEEGANLARFIFLDDHAADLFPDWSRAAEDAAAILHVEAGRTPYSKAVTSLVGELATRSELFRALWAAHDVRVHGRGTKRFRHDAVGEMTLSFEALEIAGGSGLTFVGYTAEAGSASREALRLLASWIAPEADRTERTHESEESAS